MQPHHSQLSLALPVGWMGNGLGLQWRWIIQQTKGLNRHSWRSARVITGLPSFLVYLWIISCFFSLCGWVAFIYCSHFNLCMYVWCMPKILVSYIFTYFVVIQPALSLPLPSHQQKNYSLSSNRLRMTLWKYRGRMKWKRHLSVETHQTLWKRHKIHLLLHSQWWTIASLIGII